MCFFKKGAPWLFIHSALITSASLVLPLLAKQPSTKTCSLVQPAALASYKQQEQPFARISSSTSISYLSS